MAERFESVKQVVDRTGLSKTTLYDRMKAGSFPKSIPLGPQKVAFLQSEVDAWIAAQVAARDSGYDIRRAKSQKAVACRRAMPS